ncbi:MAG: importin, partial [Benjaminiella poitrasii]
FPILLLKLISDDSVDQTLRMAGAVYFKNYIKRHWDNEGEVDKIAEQDRLEIKNQIVQLMITVPEKLQLQISDALSLIAEADFPERWTSLLPELISKLSPTDYRVNNGILGTAHSIFKRWRSAFRSDDLFLVIKYVLDLFCEPYLQLFQVRYTPKLAYITCLFVY